MADEKDLQEDIPVEDKEVVEGAGDSEETDEASETDVQKEEASDTSVAEDSETEPSGEEEEREGKEDKKLFKKKQKADKKQDALKEKIDELEDKVKRQMAEFDNFRKRTEKEKTAMFETGARSVIEKILPVVDNFERGFSSIPEEEKGTSFAAGMEMVYKQLMTELEKMDVKPIPAVGEEFDPNLHNAVMQVESEEYETGVIAQELQKGYTYRGTVVRHSMVAVVS
ncbi:MAG: nucleotide exchange factor GrpE [Lachnospiraceae bacterium]|nr:nucleotide exchange factor GrpE [Lachnospiraceae bacterium]MCI7189405.1 nucleotide exchange factor GrpE [Lachnospiraceae bacterium]MDD7628612.1 nucleotide exchange factor GrpE [Lachnospiraceae bacterium]MDY4120138.1 nucleotide exchange factor GrpE [Lachnospiraceae bacterium]